MSTSERAQESSAACPKCGHVRKATDAAPAWECPACGIAIAKYRDSLAQAAARGTTVVAVHGRVDQGVAPMRKIAGAVPDAATAGLFLWCWLAPGAWRTTLASELGLLMLMEFFTLHAGMFLGGTASVQREGIGVRLTTAAIVVVFYIPIAGAFAFFHGGWSPFLGFGWLLLIRVVFMLAGDGAGEFESRRRRFYWGTGVAYYVMSVFVVLLLPLPQLGFGRTAGVFWDDWWHLKPEQAIAWGFLYFGALAITKLFERPEWIEDAGESA